MAQSGVRNINIHVGYKLISLGKLKRPLAEWTPLKVFDEGLPDGPTNGPTNGATNVLTNAIRSAATCEGCGREKERVGRKRMQRGRDGGMEGDGCNKETRK